MANRSADPDFDARVPIPAFAKGGPRVLIDETHHNFHTASGRYKPFADLITRDDYQVATNRSRFERGTLQGYAIAVIANPRGDDTADETVAAGLAFNDEECEALRAWVSEGLLLLIADHFPSGASAAGLASASVSRCAAAGQPTSPTMTPRATSARSCSPTRIGCLVTTQ